MSGASGCGEEAPRPAVWISDPTLDEAARARRTFSLGGTSFAIVVPEAAVVGTELAFKGHSDSGHKVHIDLTKGRRLRALILATVQIDGGAAAFDRRDVLANGASLEYRIEDNLPGGSSGPHSELTGRMQIGSHVLWVSCADQDKGTRYPGWCVPFLARLEVVDRSP